MRNPAESEHHHHTADENRRLTLGLEVHLNYATEEAAITDQQSEKRDDKAYKRL